VWAAVRSQRTTHQVNPRHVVRVDWKAQIRPGHVTCAPRRPTCMKMRSRDWFALIVWRDFVLREFQESFRWTVSFATINFKHFTFTIHSAKWDAKIVSASGALNDQLLQRNAPSVKYTNRTDCWHMRTLADAKTVLECSYRLQNIKSKAMPSKPTFMSAQSVSALRSGGIKVTSPSVRSVLWLALTRMSTHASAGHRTFCTLSKVRIVVTPNVLIVSEIFTN
jgi:hypothetical protein